MVPIYTATVIKKAVVKDGKEVAPAEIVGNVAQFTAADQNSARAIVIRELHKSESKEIQAVFDDILAYEVQIHADNAAFNVF